MIRPHIVRCTEEWRPGLLDLVKTVGWTEDMLTWPWNPLTTLLAVHHGRVVGFLAGYAGQPIGIVDSLVVAPDVRGQGIGVALWRTMVDLLSSYGARRIRWLTGNPALQKMLLREGFQVVDEGALMEGERHGRTI